MINFHILPEGDRWIIVTEGGGLLEAGFESKEKALTAAVQFATQRGGSLIIHRTDGTIEEERTYPGTGDF